ncbi:P-type conjugative transfer protein TrbG [Sphingomonas colocasiae]|uniref:P-type conjugative transfer protein TrbG n=2 Tax=Sphingomonas colocasiae TaxID=1848973 RepID=A0ABS7PIN2_9SPHN|nr:P-type conjugative transfer protein TrbG [Sphingomonas colocasiae]
MSAKILIFAALCAVPSMVSAKGNDPESIQSAVRAATSEPDRQRYVNAIQVYGWSEGAIYSLHAAPERVSDIALEPGEALVSVAAGDTLRWVIGDTTSGSGAEKRVHILVKPTLPGLSTNIIIATDRRSYHVQLTSAARGAMTGMRWTYPPSLIALRAEAAAAEAQPVPAVAAGIVPEQLRFDYRIGGDVVPWKPLRVFDDGRQVYVEFGANLPQGEAPPLFLIGSTGEAELVNYRVAGRYYVVDRLFDVAELRLGTKKQKVVRITRGGRKGRGA